MVLQTVSEGEGEVLCGEGIANLKIGGGYCIRYELPGHRVMTYLSIETWHKSLFNRRSKHGAGKLIECVIN